MNRLWGFGKLLFDYVVYNSWGLEAYFIIVYYKSIMYDLLSMPLKEKVCERKGYFVPYLMLCQWISRQQSKIWLACITYKSEN